MDLTLFMRCVMNEQFNSMKNTSCIP